MRDDPAIDRAKQLIREKRAREAFDTLVNRINELNQMVQLLQQAPSRERVEASGLIQWNKMGRAVLGVVLLLILLALCGILY